MLLYSNLNSGGLKSVSVNGQEDMRINDRTMNKTKIWTRSDWRTRGQNVRECRECEIFSHFSACIIISGFALCLVIYPPEPQSWPSRTPTILLRVSFKLTLGFVGVTKVLLESAQTTSINRFHARAIVLRFWWLRGFWVQNDAGEERNCFPASSSKHARDPRGVLIFRTATASNFAMLSYASNHHVDKVRQFFHI